MSKLSIVISGVIEQSNFEEWKTDLVEKIRSVNTELKTDDDFSAATKHVKQFKAAEKSLKAAKKSALEQAAEINQLFETIDTVSEEARQARLKLSKQIKKRKQEIKDDFIQQGVDTINTFIKEQSADFQALSHSDYNDDDIFADAISGKASTKGMQKAITKICESIKAAITEKAAEVDANAGLLDKLPPNHKALFQDRGHLVSLSTEALNKTIDERVSALEISIQEKAEADEEDADEEIQTDEDLDESDEKTEDAAPVKSEDASEEDKSDYLVTIEVNATEEEADAIRAIVESALSDNSAVSNITLSTV